MSMTESITDAFAPGLSQGRPVLVTGGTSGIGLACARAFRDLGARVTATGATEAERARASDETGNAGIAFALLDVRDGPAIDALIGTFDQLAVLVNAAGVIRRDLE